MAERSFSQLPISSSSSSHIGRRNQNSRRGMFPVSDYWIHAIPVIVFLCFFTLWIFSHSVSVDMNDGEIMSIHRLEKSMAAVRNESHVSLAILASSAVSPAASGLVVSTNQNLTTPHHNATQSHNATLSHNATQSHNEVKQATVNKAKQATVNKAKQATVNKVKQATPHAS